jgi:predicted MFS family arabinose efflux permease
MTPKTRRIQVIFYALAVFAYWASLYFYVPTLSVYAEEITRDLAIVGTVISMYGLWQAVARFPLGILSDSVGRRKPFIILGFMMSALGAFIMMNAKGAPGLIIGRGVTGLSAAVWVLIMVGFASLFPPDQAVKLAAVLNIINAVGRTMATGVNGLLNQWGGYDLAFKVGIGFSILAILLFLPVKDVVRQRHRPVAKDIARLATRQDVLVPALLAALIQFVSTAAVFSFIPIIARNFGATDNHISLLTMGNIVTGVVGNLLISMLTAKVGIRPVLVSGFAISAVGVMMVATSTNYPILFPAMFILGLGWSTISILMGLSIRYVREEERSTAMGLHQSVYGFGMFFGPYLSGYIARAIGVHELFWVLLAVIIFSGFAGSIAIKRIEQKMAVQNTPDLAAATAGK